MGRGRGSAGRGRNGRPVANTTNAAPAPVAVQPPAPVSDLDAYQNERMAFAAQRRMPGYDYNNVQLTRSVTERAGNLKMVMFSTSAGNDVLLNIADSSISPLSSVAFNINNSMIRRTNMGIAERQAIAMRLLSEMRKDVRSRPDGHIYAVSAYQEDGFGAMRERAYESIGFSPASNGVMYGVVRGGRLRPSDMEGNELPRR